MKQVRLQPRSEAILLTRLLKAVCRSVNGTNAAAASHAIHCITQAGTEGGKSCSTQTYFCTKVMLVSLEPSLF